MLFTCHFQSIFIFIINKIAENKCNAFLAGGIIEKSDPFFQTCSFFLWFHGEKFPNDVQHVLLSFFWRNVFFYFVSEENNSDLIIICYCGKCKHSAYLGDNI